MSRRPEALVDRGESRPVVVLVLAIFLALSFNAVTAVSRPIQPAAAEELTDEAHFVGLINELRAEEGLAPLSINAELTRESRQWAVQLRSNNELSHAADLSVGVTTVWLKLGENVGVGPIDRIDDLFDAFVASPDHLANLLDPSFEAVGVGVVYDDEGRMWTTHRFMDIDNSAVDQTGTDDSGADGETDETVGDTPPEELASVSPTDTEAGDSAAPAIGDTPHGDPHAGEAHLGDADAAAAVTGTGESGGKDVPRTEPASLASSGTIVALDEVGASDLFDLLTS